MTEGRHGGSSRAFFANREPAFRRVLAIEQPDEMAGPADPHISRACRGARLVESAAFSWTYLIFSIR